MPKQIRRRARVLKPRPVSKKRKKSNKPKVLPPYSYKLILFRNNRFSCYKGKYRYEEKGLAALERLSKKSKEKVVFPREHNFSYKYDENHVKNDTHVLKDIYYELILVKELSEGEEMDNAILKNNIGEYVEHKITNNDNMVIISKAPYYVEESFYVFGHHPRKDRKKFSEIFSEYVAPRASEATEMLKLQVYRNKVLLEGYTSSDLVICKCKSDAVRLYNKIEEYCKSLPQFKFVMYCGDCGLTKWSSNKIVNKIHKITNWPINKIRQKMQ